MRRHIRNLLSILSPKERRIIRLRFGIEDGKEKTLLEIGNMFGLSKERVRQLENRALYKLKRCCNSQGLGAYADLLTWNHMIIAFCSICINLIWTFHLPYIRSCSFGQLEGLFQKLCQKQTITFTFVSPSSYVLYVYEVHLYSFLGVVQPGTALLRCLAIDTDEICWHLKVYLSIHSRNDIQWKWRNNVFSWNCIIPLKNFFPSLLRFR